MELAPSIVMPNQQHQEMSRAPHQHPHVQHNYMTSTETPKSEEDNKLKLSATSHPNLYEQSDMHLLPPHPSHSQVNSCFARTTEAAQPGAPHSPPRSQKSTPTPSPASSPSPPFNSTTSNVLDLNSIVSYSQLIQHRDEVITALKCRSGDHLAAQALDLLRAGRERVKRITAAGRAATGKPPVKHIQEQYLAVFSRFSDYCTSQNIPTWPIEPVRVAVWVLAMQEKAPPTPATLRQYITRLEFTCTVTAGLFENEFGASSPLKASALLRELVNRDLPGQQTTSRPPRSPSTSKVPLKRGRSPSTFDNHEGSLTPPTKKWHNFDGVPPEYVEHYDAYLSPFATSATYPNTSLVAHHHEIWPSHAHPHPDRYPAETLPHPHSMPQHYHPQSLHPLEHQHQHPGSHPRSHEIMSGPVPIHPSHRAISHHQRAYASPYDNGHHGHPSFPPHHSNQMVPPTADGRYIADSSPNPWA